MGKLPQLHFSATAGGGIAPENKFQSFVLHQYRWTTGKKGLIGKQVVIDRLDNR